MASSLETNKILAAILAAGIFASGAGVVSRILYHPTAPEEPAYLIEVAGASEEGSDDQTETELTVASLLPGADIAAGEKGVKKCAACHTFEEGGANKIGPNLWDVLGRDIGSAAGFTYSEALTGLEGNWDFEGIDAFLTKPKDYAPGTKMAYAGMKNAGDRADVILYLRSLAADPLPLPEAVEQESAENVESETAGSAQETVEETAEAVTETAEEATAIVADEAADTAAAVAEVADAATLATSEAVDQAAESAEEASDAVAEAASETVGQVAETTEVAGDTVAETADAAAVVEATETTAETASAAVEGALEQAAEATDQVTAAAGAVVAAVTETAEEAAAGGPNGLVAMIAGADLAAGEKVSKKCKACHVFDEGGKNRLGPALWGIVGQDIASHEGFKYSGALQNLDGEWTYDRLDQFLAAPKKYVPGTKMTFAGVKKETDRANLIFYLRSLAAEPMPLAEGG